jgi:hypothetical protein
VGLGQLLAFNAAYGPTAACASFPTRMHSSSAVRPRGRGGARQTHFGHFGGMSGTFSSI